MLTYQISLWITLYPMALSNYKDETDTEKKFQT